MNKIIFVFSIMEEEILYTIALNLVPKIGSPTARKLIEHFGSAKNVFLQKKQELLKINGIGAILAQNLVDKQILKIAEDEIKFCEKNNISILHYKDDEFPSLLNECEDAPTILFSRGNSDWKKKKVISIIGTRKATSYGKTQCENLIKDLTEKGYKLNIVSGLAAGIDGCAHKMALKYGQDTTAVVAHGLKNIYPADHRELATKIVNNGSVITELLSDTRPESFNFVKRNRIIAGISPAIIVIESPVKGGSMITASLANSYNRDVFSFPGKTTDKNQGGCNFLIKSNRAAMIENADDFEAFMGWYSHNPKPIQPKIFKNLSDEEKLIVKQLEDNEKVSLNALVKLTGIPINKISFHIINLEMEGVIKSLPGNFYKLV